MMQSMKGATQILGSMNRTMNLPALQRIAMEFERENDIMDQRQEMMDEAIDDITGVDEEEETDEIVEQVLEEIGVDLRQAVSTFQKDVFSNPYVSLWSQMGETPSGLQSSAVAESKVAQAVGGGGGGDPGDVDLQ